MSDTAPKTAQLTDFSDRFSPMLVKELRQGLRTNLFVTAFILLQGFMILCILMSSAETNSNSAANWFFWFFIISTLLVVQPLRGFAALSNEYNLNTMDLIQLTRLGAWRITFGKWCAINAQTFLLVVAVIPYIVLRYFFGSINLFADLGWLGLIAVGSGLASAMMVGCSAFKNLIVRLILMVGFGFLFVALCVATRELTSGRFGSSDFKSLALILYSAVFGTYFFLAFGASKIAPGSENHTTLKRLIGLAAAGGAWCFQLLGADDEVCNVVASMIIGLVIIDALTEELPIFESVLKPFSKRIITKPLAYLLTPGWHTAILFVSVICCIWILAMLTHYNFKPDNEEMCFLFSGIGTLTFPLLIIHLFLRKSKLTRFALYLFIQACLAGVTMLTVAVAEGSKIDSEIVYLFLPIPSNLFFGSMENNFNEPVYPIIALTWLVASIVITMLFSGPLYRKMATTMKNK